MAQTLLYQDSGPAGSRLGGFKVKNSGSGRLEGKVAIITGGSGGIGLATAREFVKQGARVFLVDLALEPLAAAANEFGDRAAFALADVSSADDTQRYVRDAVSRFGGVDIVFANAGIEGAVRALTETSIEDFDRVMSVNVRGAWLAIQHSVPVLTKRGGGSIIVTSSVAGLVGSAGMSPYVTSKHAVMGLVKCAALELAPLGIRVNSVNPGPIENRMMRSIERQANPNDPTSVKDGFLSKVALNRYGTNEEIANVVVFLASDESGYCTGTHIVADGGFVAG
jgi:3alpha(or 20beta)-hydroxysteroid dehydrogenase